MLLGIDIGGTKCSVVLGGVSADGIPAISGKSFLDTWAPAEQMIEGIFVEAERLLREHAIGKDALKGIGISCGGPLDCKKGVILSPPNLPGWDDVAIVEIARKRFECPVLLQNDANACAVAEWKWGAGKGVRNMIFLTFGTGMGAGLILNGQLYSGTNDMAGEVGHWRLAADGPEGYGKAGSFEGFCSGGGIARMARARAKELFEAGTLPGFCKAAYEIDSITTLQVAAAAFDGDEEACAIFRKSAQQLGAALSLMIDLLNPERIVIGSIYNRCQPLFDEALLAVVQQEALHVSAGVCAIVPAGFGELLGDVAALSLAEIAAGGISI